MSKQRAAKRSKEDWEKIMSEWEASGLTQHEFTKRLGINPGTFQGRLWRIRRQREDANIAKDGAPRFVEIKQQQHTPTSKPKGLKISMTRTEIEFSSTPDATWLAEFVSIANSRS